MRNKSLIITLTVIVSALCLYFLSFSFVAHNVQKDAEAFATDAQGNIDLVKKQDYLDSIWKEPVFLGYTYQEIKENELGLGLDLKGGMHVVLEVSPVEIIKSMSGNSKDPNFLKALARAQELQKNSQERFTTLFAQAYREVEPDGRLSRIFSNSANRGKISYESSNKEVIDIIDKEVEDAIGRSFNILRTRIDKFGVNQPNIQRLKGSGRIQIELPGIDNPERVRKLLQGMANLEFWEVWSPQEFSPYFMQLNEYLTQQEKAGNLNLRETETKDPLKAAAAKGDVLAQAAASDSNAVAAADTTAKDTAAATLAAADSLANQGGPLARLFTQLPNGIGANVRDTAKINDIFARADVRAIFPPNMKFLWDVKPIAGDNRQEFVELYAVKKGRDGKAPLSGDAINDARQDFDQQGRPEINMTMNPTGAKKWARLTGNNVGRQIAIVLDNYVYSAPVVQGEITGGSSSISGNFTIEEAQDLANILKAGKMPAPTRIVEEAIVGPSLGQEAINQGLLSTLAGLVIVVVFMIAYYSRGGFIADLALVFNIFFILGILAQFNAALTLPGIAGIVLTLGMAVDANVLIFERMREEARKGLSMREVINKGYDKAFITILDANVTTFLAGFILYFFGSGPVKGFAITLMLGIVTSFFTSVYISRLLIERSFLKKGKLSFSNAFAERMFQNVKFDVMKWKKPAYAFSLSILIFGFVAMAIKGPNLGVDFQGGRSYVVEFDKAIPASDVRAALTDNFHEEGTEVKTFGASNRVKVITSWLADDESLQADEQVKAALDAGLSEFSDLNPEVLSSSKVGATVADDIQNTAVIALLLSLVGIFIYVMFRFSKWQFSLGGVVALLHDALMIIAIFAILDLFGISYEMDQIFIAAVLTIIGFSINDTVVIFDRVREYMNDNPKAHVREIINPALIDTFSRTIITSVTVFMVVLVLFIFGGEILRGFSLAMLIGVVFGVYSTLFIASPIVVDTMKDEKKPAPAPQPTAKKVS
ncbi:protein translocase subunit SecDF [Pontibacter sp. BT310]|uniref:Multifunctional fusion protein n=1 Tax=Pontibacter populi TaxID=890055 RepID=A0ABS6X8Y4_9BACT|nr:MULTISPECIES: protein translocase subunit SecDF [Pontibacter]MBJ6117125.1 protein translocase subunit SecDF [Pontibacter sp. BT310]MBR0569549.1 protein translocase subunit SecDF [Microvirga sp. STS03]MBW3363978.1 protein translocase subunit SecDF [Pontibacter populi]